MFKAYALAALVVCLWTGLAAAQSPEGSSGQVAVRATSAESPQAAPAIGQDGTPATAAVSFVPPAIPVPEPGAMALLGIGGVAVLACRRRRRPT